MIVVYKNNQPFDMLDIEEFNETDYFHELLDLMGGHHPDFTAPAHDDDTRVQAARMVC
jgi:hypothetical protein